MHDVGYRVFLLKHAMNLAIPGLSVYNWDKDGQQQVIALVEADEGRIATFKQVATEKKPELAEVSEVAFEPYDEDIGRASELAMFCSFVQLDKAIPLMLKMNERSRSSDNKLGSIDDKLGSMNEKMDSLAENMGSMAENMGSMAEKVGSMAENMGSMAENMGSMAENMGSMAENQKETLEEIRGLREDLVGSREWQRRIERDISVIKSKVGIR